MEDHLYVSLEHIAQYTYILILLLDHAKIYSVRAPKYKDYMFNIDIGDMVLIEEQQNIKDNIQSPQGLHIFTMLLVLVLFPNNMLQSFQKYDYNLVRRKLT